MAAILISHTTQSALQNADKNLVSKRVVRICNVV